MKKIVVENINEFRNNKSLNKRNLNEGIFDSLKTKITKFLDNPTNDIIARKLLSSTFANEFSTKPKTKELILNLPLEEKIDILQQAVERLNDSKIGILRLLKDPEGNIVVGGVGVRGGASTMTSGA